MSLSKALPKDPEWLYQHQIADRYLDDFANAFTHTIEDLQNAAKVEVIEEALARGRPTLLINFISMQENMEDSLSAHWTPVLNKILDKTGAEVLQRLGADTLFTIRNPYAEGWAIAHAGELVKEVIEETRLAIARSVQYGMALGRPPEVLARRMRKWIGLTSRQELAVMRYWDSLVGEDMKSLAQADKLAGAYTKRLLKQRALNIARTETINASVKGTQVSWQHARDYGFIAPDAVQEWIAATLSDRTCERCMAFDGVQTPIGGVFVSRDGETSSGPTLHPSCRCAVGLVTPTD